MTILESPIQIRYYTPGVDFARYIIPNIHDASATPWFTDKMIIVNGIYGHQNFNQEDFYDDSYINIRLLPTYKIQVYYNDTWFEYNPYKDLYEKFQDCFNFILSCYEHCMTINTIDELD